MFHRSVRIWPLNRSMFGGLMMELRADINPYVPPQEEKAEDHKLPGDADVFWWKHHRLEVSAEFAPLWLPLFAVCHVSVDGGPATRSTILRPRGRVEFVIEDDGRAALACLETFGVVFWRQYFRIHVDGTLAVEGYVHVNRWLASMLAGFPAGVVIGLVITGVLWGMSCLIWFGSWAG